jgi:hypothetical protein
MASSEARYGPALIIFGSSTHAMLLLRFDERADVPWNVSDSFGPPEVSCELAVRAREQPLRRRAQPRWGRHAQLDESHPLGVGG